MGTQYCSIETIPPPAFDNSLSMASARIKGLMVLEVFGDFWAINFVLAFHFLDWLTAHLILCENDFEIFVLIYESSEYKRCVSSANIVETKFGSGLRLSGFEPAKMTLSGISNFL